ncbi:uncharacterized protein MELLADRAFT_79696 [Melampsora larici-populina 98AG31]|uniref:Uncharacterized protein n=1 Tax=Melampsora larici-populina (strain 98AG31 / pathotype 3-4-7) TaxID=747676 RepID=F4SA99_MELLP|nr:uncharacterized protein MELLADRAFT_79696 [Melampsora larici-populina 98AG31]EGF98440.1 hypothetical protein MELLADRAFT_79696 [Melampsora larici-populina 98AG31]
MAMSPTSDVVTNPVFDTGINALVDYTIWVPKIKSGKKAGLEPSWESAKPDNKIRVFLLEINTSSFRNARLQVLFEIQKSEVQAATVLSAADKGEGSLGDLKWQAYIATSRLYPKSGNRVKFITNDAEWNDWLHICNASKDKVCGLKLVMENPTLAQRKKRKVRVTVHCTINWLIFGLWKNEAVLIEAAKITRRHDRKQKQKLSKKTHCGGDQGLTAEELALDDDPEPPSPSDSSLESCESTGGDTDTDAVKIVADLIYKHNPIKPSYHQSIPVYVDPKETDRFFYITAGMSRIWAKEKLVCDSKGTQVVTTCIPPKAGIQWLSQSAEQLKRKKPGSSGDSAITDMLKHIMGSIVQPPIDAAEGSTSTSLSAPIADYLIFCGIKDEDRSIEACLTEAGLDQYTLFNREFLPRKDLLKLNLVPGVVTRLYMNVKAFAKHLNESNIQ